MIKLGTPPYLECSTRGDARFSAFCAYVNGRSIEEQYQAAKIFEDGSTGLTWREAKGRKAINQEDCAKLYSKLWDEYIIKNPELLLELRKATGLSDMFGQEGHVCQAVELWRIRNNRSENMAHFPVYKIEIVCKDTFGDTHKEYLMRMIEDRIKYMLEADFILSVSHFKMEEQNVTDIR